MLSLFGDAVNERRLFRVQVPAGVGGHRLDRSDRLASRVTDLRGSVEQASRQLV